MTGPADNDIPSQQDLPSSIPTVPIAWGARKEGSGAVECQAEYVSEEGTGPDGRQQVSFVAKAVGFQDEAELDRALEMKVALDPEAPSGTIPTAEEAGEDPEPEDSADPKREVVFEMSLDDTNRARKEPMNFVIDPYCNTDTRFRYTAMNGTINQVYVRCTGGSIAIRCGNGNLRVIRAGTGRIRLPNCSDDLYVRCRQGGTQFYVNLIWILV
jgi:hypothetical protein